MKTVGEHSPDLPKTKSRFRWVMLGLVWGVYASFGIGVGSILPLVDPIVEDLGISYSSMGFVLGVWQLVFIATAYPMGMMVDKWGTRRALGAGIVVVWLSLVLRGLAIDFVTLSLAVGLFGIGGPLISIGAPKVVSQWFTGKERGLAAGIYATAPVSGMVLALSTAGSVVLSVTGSWRGISLVYGIVILFAIAAWWLFSKDVAKSHRTEVSTDRPSFMNTLTSLLAIRNIQLLLVLAVGVFFLNHGFTSWAPTLLKERGMTLAAAGFWTAVATAISVLGTVTISGIAPPGRRVLTMVGLLVLATVSTTVLAFVSGHAIIAPLIVSNWVRMPMMAVLSLLVMETRGVGTLRVGAAMGLFFVAAEIGGFSGPFVVGLLRDSTGELMWGVLALAIAAGAMVVVMPFIRESKETMADPESS